MRESILGMDLDAVFSLTLSVFHGVLRESIGPFSTNKIIRHEPVHTENLILLW